MDENETSAHPAPLLEAVREAAGPAASRNEVEAMIDRARHGGFPELSVKAVMRPNRPLGEDYSAEVTERARAVVAAVRDYDAASAADQQPSAADQQPCRFGRIEGEPHLCVPMLTLRLPDGRHYHWCAEHVTDARRYLLDFA